MSYIEKGQDINVLVLTDEMARWKLFLQMQTEGEIAGLLSHKAFQPLEMECENLNKENTTRKILSYLEAGLRNKSIYEALPGRTVVDDRVAVADLKTPHYWARDFILKVAFEMLGKPPQLDSFKERVLMNSKSIAVIATEGLMNDWVTYEDRIKRKEGGSPDLEYRGSFGKKRSIGIGTAFLVASDLLMTSSHTFEGMKQEQLDKLRYVFGWSEDQKGDLTNSSQLQVLRGDLVGDTLPKVPGDDYVLIQLRGKVDHGGPIFNTSTRMNPQGRWVYTLGYPGGIPQVFVPDGKWISGGDQRFKTNLDIFGGNSGSPVFDLLTHQLLGMVLGGEDDFHRKGNIITEKRYCYETTSRHAGEWCHRISYIHTKLKDYLPSA